LSPFGIYSDFATSANAHPEDELLPLDKRQY
jgi:hypothetical protein